jgi:hypothetical protein
MVNTTHSATPARSAGAAKTRPTSEKSGSTEVVLQGAQAQDGIARRAYELYEKRGRQEGRALEDWSNAEQQLVGGTGQS